MSPRVMSLLIFNSLPWLSLMMLLQGCSVPQTLNTSEKILMLDQKKQKKPKKQKTVHHRFCMCGQLRYFRLFWSCRKENWILCTSLQHLLQTWTRKGKEIFSLRFCLSCSWVLITSVLIIAKYWVHIMYHTMW